MLPLLPSPRRLPLTVRLLFKCALDLLLTFAFTIDTFPSLVVGGVTTAAWVNVRKTNNFNSRVPVTDVTSADLRCYDSAEPGTATTIQVAAGSQFGILSDGTMYHPSVVNVYMAKAPSSVDGWAGDGAVWFKVYELSAVTDGGQSITFPAESTLVLFCPLTLRSLIIIRRGRSKLHYPERTSVWPVSSLRSHR